MEPYTPELHHQFVLYNSAHNIYQTTTSSYKYNSMGYKI